LLLPRHSNRAADALKRPPSGGAAEISTMLSGPESNNLALLLLEACRIDYVQN
jgi:hypothetical protein